MQAKNPRRDRRSWWLLGATGLLQPLSEDFLYRSPQQPAAGSWRAAPGVGSGRGGRRDA